LASSFTVKALESILLRMGSTRFLFQLTLALTMLAASNARCRPLQDGKPITELTFTKGDTREGTRVRLRFIGDSVFYERVEFHPDRLPLETSQSMRINGARSGALKRLMGELPRYRTFGSCWGEGMRYYMVTTADGKFYRSLPERSGRCFTDEPGIFSLFDDMDTLLEPPLDEDFEEYSLAS
jgi:hypothetical protein